MCPACYAALAWTIAGATAAGGATTFTVVKVVKKRTRSRKVKEIEVREPLRCSAH